MPELAQVSNALNGSGTRYTARVLRISPTTVIAVLKKPPTASRRQPRVGTPPSFTYGEVPSGRARDRSKCGFCRPSGEPWLWHAIGHQGKCFAYCGPRKEFGVLKLTPLLAPLDIEHYTRTRRGYQRHLPLAQHTVGKLTKQRLT